MKRVLTPVRTFLLIVGCALINSSGASVESANAIQTSDTPAEREIRAGFCDFQRKDYTAAQKHFAKALELDPAKKDASSLVAGMLWRRFKPEDKSPENIALAREAIASYQKVVDDPASSSARKEKADEYIVELYGEISKEEQQRALLARAEATNWPKEKRAKAYFSLAFKLWECSFDITGQEQNKRSVLRAGKRVTVHIMPSDSKLFEKARGCATKGLEYADRAISLDNQYFPAWTQKANLLSELAKIAEMEGAAQKKLDFERQLKGALAASERLSEAERSKEVEETTSDEDSGRSFQLTPETIKAMTTEATYFRAEPRIEDLVEEMSGLPSDRLMALFDDKSGSREERRRENEANLQAKREWKQLAPPSEDFSILMPSPIQQYVAGEPRTYDATSEGVSYRIYSLKRDIAPADFPTIKPENFEATILNVLANATAPILTRFLRIGDVGAASEVTLMRTGLVSGHQSRQYAVSVTSCEKTTPGVLHYYYGKNRNYIVLINGADEKDVRSRRLLESLRLS